MYSWKARITLPYTDCSGIVLRWATRCAKVAVYEHEADEDVTKTHIHLALIGCDIKEEALKRIWKDAPGSGNEFWSITPMKEESRYLTYMTKGMLCPKFTKLFSKEEVEASRLAWVDPILGSDKKTDATDYYITVLTKKFDYLQHYADLPDSIVEPDHNGFNVTIGCYSVLYRNVRSVGMKMFLGRNKFRTPHKSMFCTVTNSVFMAIMNRIDCLDQGVELILEKY